MLTNKILYILFVFILLLVSCKNKIAKTTDMNQSQQSIKKGLSSDYLIPNGNFINFDGWIRRYENVSKSVYSIDKVGEDSAAKITVTAKDDERLRKVAYIATKNLPKDVGSYFLELEVRSDLEKGWAGIKLTGKSSSSYKELVKNVCQWSL